MSDHPSKSLEEMSRYDDNQGSDKINSHSVPNLRRKRSIRSVTCSSKSSEKNNNDVKRRKKNEQKESSLVAVPSCSKEDKLEASKLESTDLHKFLQEELTCSICSEIFVHAVTLNCSHSFCEFCILKWMKEQSTCPVCREEIASRNSSLVLDRFVEKIVEHLPEESKNHRREVVELREKQKEFVPPVLDPADPDTEQLINDFLCWFGISEFMEVFDMRNHDEDPTNYDQNENCTIN